MLLSIVIPVYNPAHLEHKVDKFLIPQLEAFKRNTTMTGMDLVYVVNGSTQKTLDVLQDYAKTLPIRILAHAEGLGFTKATNLGIQASQGEIVLMFNDDALILDYLPRDAWRDWLLKPFFTDPRVGFTGVHELWCQHSRAFFFIGYCLACRRTMLESIGLLDEVFSPGAGEDTDLCIRARLHGWTGVNVDPVAHNMIHHNAKLKPNECTFPVYHPGETTFHHWETTNDFKPGSKWDVIFKRNGQILAERYKSGYYAKPQPRADTVPQLAPRANVVTTLFAAGQPSSDHTGPSSG